jgi:SAM-dependent methyltransferase
MSRDVWDDSSAYESYMGRWSRLIAVQFIRWLDLPRGGAWLDVGCGTGALTREILAQADPRLVIGCDRSADYAAFADARTADDRAQFLAAELSNLPQTPGGFDAVIAGLVLNFFPVPLDGIVSMAARARRGGIVAGYVWDYAEGMQMIRVFWDAACALDEAARTLDEGIRFPLCQPEPLQRLFVKAGLHDVQVRSIRAATVLRDFDDYWIPFLGGQGPAPGYAMSLPADRRELLRDDVRRRMPVAPDGTIRLTARAWAVKGGCP